MVFTEKELEDGVKYIELLEKENKALRELANLQDKIIKNREKND